MSKRKLELALPFPQSVNHYWRHTRAGKHYISDEGKRYQSQVFMLCMAELPFTQAVEISVEVTMPDNRARDLDNLWKVLQQVQRLSYFFSKKGIAMHMLEVYYL